MVRALLTRFGAWWVAVAWPAIYSVLVALGTHLYNWCESVFQSPVMHVTTAILTIVFYLLVKASWFLLA